MHQSIAIQPVSTEFSAFCASRLANSRRSIEVATIFLDQSMHVLVVQGDGGWNLPMMRLYERNFKPAQVLCATVKSVFGQEPESPRYIGLIGECTLGEQGLVGIIKAYMPRVQERQGICWLRPQGPGVPHGKLHPLLARVINEGWPIRASGASSKQRRH